MNSEETQEYLAGALGELARADPSLDDEARLTEWYVIAVHQTPSGPVFSRYTPPGQPDWTDMGLLRLAAKLDESELTWADAED
jgi:hypothetical protein